MHKVADKFMYLCIIGAVPGARKDNLHALHSFFALVTIHHHNHHHYHSGIRQHLIQGVGTFLFTSKVDFRRLML